MKKLLLGFGFLLGARLALASPATGLSFVGATQVQEVISTPEQDVHQRLAQYIGNAQKSVKIWMFTWSDTLIADALVKAHQRGIQVQVILDSGNFRSHFGGAQIQDEPESTSPIIKQKVVQELQQEGIETLEASAAFNLMHAKTLLIDDKLSIIMSLNLTKIAGKVRDTAVVLKDPAVARDLAALFDQDRQNSQDRGHETITPSNPALIISPTNASDSIVNLLASAQKEILLTTENFGDAPVIQSITDALQRGVKVSIIAPLCDMSPDHFYNIPHLKPLANLGAQVHVMPSPASASQPYMHQKLIQVDGKVAFVGSENLSFNSLKNDRELGVIFEISSDAGIASRFAQDWQNSVDLPRRLPAACSPL